MKNSKIKKIEAREILDSRGNPTVEVDLITNKGCFRDSVPSGTSKGKYEAVELRDGGKRYGGMGVKKAVENINKIISPKLQGRDVLLQKDIDNLMIVIDGTDNKSHLGANAILGVSMAVCRAAAATKNFPLWRYISHIAGTRKIILPIPSVLVIEGGAHAGNDLDFQEFMIASQFKEFYKNLQASTEIYQELKSFIKKKYTEAAVNVGDEGGFAVPIKNPEEAITLILKIVEKLGYKNKIKIILDVAASQFFEKDKYKTQMGVFNKDGFLRYYSNLISNYPILGIEDPFSEEDWIGFKKITDKFGKEIVIIGDDLLVTNPKRIKTANDKGACNGLLLKINQIGTISEALEAVNLAKSFGWKIMVSHRSGETLDDFIADLAVGIGANFIKTGAPARGERMAKYNRLLKIEEEI